MDERIFSIHKAAYFGYNITFWKLYSYDLHSDYYSTLNYCISKGCVINPEFRSEILNSNIVVDNLILNNIKNELDFENENITGVFRLLKAADIPSSSFLISPQRIFLECNMKSFANNSINKKTEIEYKMNRDIDLYSGNTTFYDAKNKSCLRGVLYNVDYAKRMYDKGIVDKHILTSLISYDPEKYLDDFKKYKICLAYFNNINSIEWIEEYIKIDARVKYPLYYNIIRLMKRTVRFMRSEIPGYNIYILAKQLKLKTILDKYYTGDKIIKIFDIETWEYLDPPIEINKNEIVIPEYIQKPYYQKFEFQISEKYYYFEDDGYYTVRDLKKFLSTKLFISGLKIDE